jgi:hypothetical protein
VPLIVRDRLRQEGNSPAARLIGLISERPHEIVSADMDVLSAKVAAMIVAESLLAIW